jgi:transcriptional regulator with XRE-family HTH domain
MEETLAQRIRELRNKKGWSVYDLAKKLRNEKGKSMTAGYISKIEARGEIPSPQMIIQLAELLGVKPESLIEIAKAEKADTVSRAVQQKYDDGLVLYRRSKRT